MCFAGASASRRALRGLRRGSRFPEAGYPGPVFPGRSCERTGEGTVTQTNDKANEMGTKGVGRLLLEYSIPAILGMIIVALNQIISAIYIGHGVGHLALAAMAVTFPLINLLMAFCQLVAVGCAALCSRSMRRMESSYFTASMARKRRWFAALIRKMRWAYRWKLALCARNCGELWTNTGICCIFILRFPFLWASFWRDC